MKRGDIILVSLPRDYGKPRPAVIIQADAFAHLHSITVLPLTTDVVSAEKCRVAIENTPENGLLAPSQIMVEKISTLPRNKAERKIGALPASEMAAVDRALATFLGLV